MSTIAVLNVNNLPYIRDEEWSLISNARDALHLFQDITVEMSSEKSITLSQVIVIVRSMRHYIRDLSAENDSLNPIFKNMLKTLSDEIVRRFSLIEQKPIYAEATFLDPRFKKQGFIDLNNFKETELSITRQAQRIISNVHSNEAEESTTTVGTS